MITLIDGRQVDEADISFDANGQRFSGGGEDLTNLIYRKDKLAFTGYDVSKDNERIYEEKFRALHGTQAPKVGSTSTLGVFTDQILTDPLGAPIAAADKAFEQITGSSSFKAIAVIGIIVIAGVIYFKTK